MSYIQYRIDSPVGTIRRQGAVANSLICYYGGTPVQTITSKTDFNKSTANKMMSGNLQFGNSSVIQCANKMMPANINIRTSVTSGSNFHIITSSGSWVVPPNVSHINVFIVGGGAGGGCRYTTGSTSVQSTSYGCGGAGGYVNRGSYNVTPGSTFTCVIGTGGNGAWGDGVPWTRYLPTAGNESSFSGNGITLKAAGGNVYNVRWSGNGGSAGGHGGTFDVEPDYSSRTSASAGKSNGESTSTTPGGSYGKGQVDVAGPNGETGNTTCSVDGVAYSGGGGGGASYAVDQTYGCKPGGAYGGGHGGGAAHPGSYTLSTNGTANSGGGGGGGGHNYNNAPIGCCYGRNGGSGVIIISW